MCGIAGAVDLHDPVAPDVDGLLATVHHRGPDATGVFSRPGVALGQTRLAVVDLVTGDPPIANEDGTIGVALNGEIYGYASLRAELLAAGHELATTGDTEVIAHLAEDLDPVALCRRLDGMFAFAVWDDRRRRLVLGRDRFGKKPLHYWHDGHRLVFGSEIKALLAHPAVPRRLDAGAIPAYLTFGYVPHSATFYDGVRSVPPGHVLTFDAGGLRVAPYWRPPLPGVDCEHLDLGPDEQRRELRRLLCDAVDRRRVADVPIGAFLSGGVDSSAVVAFLARLSPRPVKTFTIGFDDRGGSFDERPYAAKVAAAYGTDHTELVVQPDVAEVIERLVWHHDQPFGDSSALPTFWLSELTRRHVTVALSGDGGDELFAGYQRFGAALLLDRFERLPAVVRRTAVDALGRIPAWAFGRRAAGANRMLARSGEALPWSYLSWINYTPSEWVERLVPGAGPQALDGYGAVWAATEGAGLLDRLQHLNVRTYLVDDLLVKVDRMAMAHGLEVRSPFLDTALAEFALRLPPRSRIRRANLKWALKDVVRDLLPREILHRRKRGFGVPLDRWFRTDLRPWVRGLLTGGEPRVNGYVRPEAVASLLESHDRGVDHGHTIWALLTLELFLRQADR
jgi:asparagine synthase (glutamine-hydrolysing)